MLSSLEDSPRASAPVVVTYTCSENGTRKTKQTQVEADGEFEIKVEAEPEDESVELAIPSSPTLKR